MTELSFPIRIMLVDDHLLFREGMTSMLKRDDRFEVVCEADDGETAVEIASECTPDVVLMDIWMPGIGGIEATRRILADHPDTRVIMITVSEKEHDLFEAVKAGAQGYLLKADTDSKYMREAIVRVAAGDAIIPPAMAPRLLEEFAALAQKQPGDAPAEMASAPEGVSRLRQAASTPPASPQPGANLLTPREFQVLELVAQGRTNKGIAAELIISENTVRSHLRSIMDKLHTNNRVQAALWIQEQGRK